MGNSSSSSGRHHDETVDYGSLVPQGVYTGPRDWNQSVVTQLIVQRKLAPFYRPLEEYEESWDDDQILAARKELPESSEHGHDAPTRPEAGRSSHGKRPSSGKEFRPEAAVYRGATECPICFLVRPCPVFSPCPPQFITSFPSIILPISTNPDAAAKLSARSALCKSSELSLLPPTSSPNPPRAPTVSKTTLVWYILLLPGEQALAAMALHPYRLRTLPVYRPKQQCPPTSGARRATAQMPPKLSQLVRMVLRTPRRQLIIRYRSNSTRLGGQARCCQSSSCPTCQSEDYHAAGGR